jgi:hypothetical protein
VQRRQRVGQVVADPGAGRHGEGRLDLFGTAQDVTVDELHHVEGRLVDRLIGA